VIEAWLRAFLVTAAVELLVAVPLLGRSRPAARRAAAVLLGQLATHPLVWFVWPSLGLGRTAFLVVAESWAFVIELATYRLVFPDLPTRRAAASSALANGASLAVGLLFRG
jgi:hypothetical protein